LLLPATNLRKLGRAVEAEQVERRLVAFDPKACDWVMHFDQIDLGDVEMSRGKFTFAQAHFVLAYDIAIMARIPEFDRLSYEPRAWERLSGVDSGISHDRLNEDLLSVQGAIAAASSSPGWHILLGLLYEKQGDLDSARKEYAMTKALAPQAAFPLQQLERLHSYPATVFPFNWSLDDVRWLYECCT